tara:strand:- start:169 stop:306 length:138 start_codon:yes stop_codon:yes gene_type:complete
MRGSHGSQRVAHYAPSFPNAVADVIEIGNQRVIAAEAGKEEEEVV